MMCWRVDFVSYTPVLFPTTVLKTLTQSLARAARPINILREVWLATRAPHNPLLFSRLHSLALLAREEQPRGFLGYLKTHPSIGQHQILHDWHAKRNDEWHLDFGSTIFPNGSLRAHVGPHSKHVIVFLPGYFADADNVLNDKEHPQYLLSLAHSLGASLVTWTWPFQGNRGENALFRGQHSVLSAEREYVRILPSYGTSLWRELIAELQFALLNIRRYFGSEKDLHIVGWSMGGGLSYYAPLLSDKIATVIAVGSCARVVDLIETGTTRAHSYYFYPHNSLTYFDLDDVVFDVVEKGTNLGVIYGDKDHSCLKLSVDAICNRLPIEYRKNISVIPDHGHNFSASIKQAIFERLRHIFENTKI